MTATADGSAAQLDDAADGRVPQAPLSAGLVHVISASGARVPVRLPDGSLATLPNADWVVGRFRFDCPTITLIDLIGPANARATWFVDQAGIRLADRIELLPLASAQALRAAILTRGLNGLGLGTDATDTGWDDRFILADLVADPTRSTGQGLTLRTPSGAELVLRYGHLAPIERFNDGWRCRALFTGIESVWLLDLEHEDGLSAFWIVSAEGIYLGNAFADLFPALRDAVLRFNEQRLEALGRGEPINLRGFNWLSDTLQSEIRSYQPGAVTGSVLVQDADLPALPRCPPQPGALRPGWQLDPAAAASDQRLEGWITVDGQHLLSGAGSTVELDLPYLPRFARLQLDLAPERVPCRLIVSLDGWELARIDLNHAHAVEIRHEIWLPGSCITSLHPRLEFGVAPGADAPVARVSRLVLEIGEPMPAVEALPPDKLFARFSSLGRDCEFGFVQRMAGLEPLNLFRFASYKGSSINLIRMLDQNLDGLGAPGSLTSWVASVYRQQPNKPGEHVIEYFMADPVRLLFFHSWIDPSSMPEEDARRDNERKLAYQVRAMREDLEDGEQIWVYTDARPETDPAEVLAIYSALNRLGPNKLFWVSRARDGRPSGSVEWIAERLLRGYSDRPHKDPQDFEVPHWTILCTAANAAFERR